MGEHGFAGRLYRAGAGPTRRAGGCASARRLTPTARLGRTLRAWRQQVLAYFATKSVSNGDTGAINLLIEKTRRLAHGFRNFGNYRLRILLGADGTRPYRRQ